MWAADVRVRFVTELQRIAANIAKLPKLVP